MPDPVLDTSAVADLCDRARLAVEQGDVPACQLAVGFQGRIVLSETYGAPADSRFVVFSVTKPFVAAVVWQLLSEGALELSRPVAADIPEFGTNGKDAVTLEQVLLHTGGFPHAPLAPALWNDREGRVRRFGDWRLNWDPGTRFEYHAASGHWVLAELITRVTGQDFRAAVSERLLTPLGLKAFALGVEPEDTGDVQDVTYSGSPPDAAEIERATGIALDLGDVVDDATLLEFNTAAGRRAGMPGGGGISTAADVALFYQALLHNPERLWEPEILADVTSVVHNTFTDPMTGDPANRSRGLVIKGDDGRGERRHDFGPTTSSLTFGHAGVGGQIAWADPASGLSFCFLTNGLERDPIRQARRSYAISKRAGVLRSASGQAA